MAGEYRIKRIKHPNVIGHMGETLANAYNRWIAGKEIEIIDIEICGSGGIAPYAMIIYK